MPRKPRFNLPGGPQHVIQRGNNREPCFYGEQDYQRYLGDIRDKEVANQFDLLKLRHLFILLGCLNDQHYQKTPAV